MDKEGVIELLARVLGHQPPQKRNLYPLGDGPQKGGYKDRTDLRMAARKITYQNVEDIENIM